jgi:hypothetical protein
MLFILLIWLSSFLPTPDYFARHRFVGEDGATEAVICFKTDFSYEKKKDILTVTTGRTETRFFILKYFIAEDGWYALGIIPGNSNQPYFIQEKLHVEQNLEEYQEYYTFVYRPTQVAGRPKLIRGEILEVSNRPMKGITYDE